MYLIACCLHNSFESSGFWAEASLFVFLAYWKGPLMWISLIHIAGLMMADDFSSCLRLVLDYWIRLLPIAGLRKIVPRQEAAAWNGGSIHSSSKAEDCGFNLFTPPFRMLACQSDLHPLFKVGSSVRSD